MLSLAFAAASKEEKRLARSKPLGPAMREWEEGRREFEQVERYLKEKKRRQREKQSYL